MRKIILTAVVLITLVGCTKKESDFSDTTNNSVTEIQKPVSENDSDESTLPSLPEDTTKEIAESLGLELANLSNETSAIPNIEALISEQSNPEPNPEAMEAMDPDSTKDCASYEAQILKDMCYNARGLSDNSNDQLPNSQ